MCVANFVVSIRVVYIVKAGRRAAGCSDGFRARIRRRIFEKRPYEFDKLSVYFDSVCFTSSVPFSHENITTTNTLPFEDRVQVTQPRFFLDYS